MFARAVVLSLASSSALVHAAGLQLDVGSQDSIKSTSKILASSIVAAYKDSLAENSIPGLFDDDYYFWEAGAVFGGLIDYSRLTGDTEYNELLSEGMQWQLGEFDSFMPSNQTSVLGNDDQSFWGLAAMTAAEANLPKPKNGNWIDFATNVFNQQAERFQIEEGSNGTCDGGLRWQIFSFNNGYDYKNTISNANFFLLASRLAKFTGNATYSEWAEKSYSWVKDAGYISDDFAVFDGASAIEDCKEINRIQWTYNHASYVEGVSIMYNMTGDSGNWTDSLRGLVNSTGVFLEDNVLVEVACEKNGKCDIDQRAFKGVAARSYARAAVEAPSIASKLTYMLEESAKGAVNACQESGEDVNCKLSWANSDSEWESASAKDGNLGEVFDALAVVQSLLYKSAAPVASGNGTTTGGSANNATQSGGAAAPEHTGSAGRMAASIGSVFAVAFIAALSS